MMEITVQRDGRIAVREHGEEPRFLDAADPLAILSVFRAVIVFEEGLTLRQLARAVRPWSAIVGRAAWMDFDAWFRELDKTHLVAGGEVMDDLECVEIYCGIDVHRDEDGSVRIETHWDFHGVYAVPVERHGYVDKVCSLSFSAPKSYSNLPLRINAAPQVQDMDVGPPKGKRPILRESLPGVYDRIELLPTFFDTVVLGLFDKISFHGSPEETGEIGESLSSMAEQIRAGNYVTLSQDDLLDKEGEPELVRSEADEKLVVVSSDIDELLGLDIDRNRRDAAFALWREAKDIPLPDPELAEKLDLTDIGLLEVQQGTTAHFSLAKLRSMTEIIRRHKEVASAE
jgi:hypothetical protein